MRVILRMRNHPPDTSTSMIATQIAPLTDIRNGSSYVCVNGDGRIVGTFFFTQGRDVEPTYRVIADGAWLDDSAYGVVHRVATDGSEKAGFTRTPVFRINGISARRL